MKLCSKIGVSPIGWIVLFHVSYYIRIGVGTFPPIPEPINGQSDSNKRIRSVHEVSIIYLLQSIRLVKTKLTIQRTMERWIRPNEWRYLFYFHHTMWVTAVYLVTPNQEYTVVYRRMDSNIREQQGESVLLYNRAFYASKKDRRGKQKADIYGGMWKIFYANLR